MKEIAVAVTVLATLEVPDDLTNKEIDRFVKTYVPECVETFEEFNINDIEWSFFNR